MADTLTEETYGDFEEVSTEEEVIEVEVEERLIYSDDDLNLVFAFEQSDVGREALKKIANIVYDNFTDDYDNTTEYRERAAEDWRVFVGDMPEKTYPYENSANPNVPIMLENLTRVHARLVGEIFGDWKNIAGYVPTGPEDKEMAENLSLHLNWQLRTQIRDFSRQMDRAVLAQLIHGDMTCHSYWDEDNRVNRHEVLTVDQFIPAYTYVSVAPDYSDISHHTKILYLSEHDLERRDGDWANVQEAMTGGPPSWEDEPEAVFATQVNDSMGVETPDTDGPHRILEYEGWIKLPEQTRHRWCKVILHHATKHILSMMIHEEPDWREEVRHEGQRLEAEAYKQQKGFYDEQLAQRNADAGMFEEMASTDEIVGPEFRQASMDQANSIPYPSIPQRPQWMEADDSEPEKPRMVPIRLYSHGVGLENMAGAHGVPVGRIQADFNRSANTMLSQFIDAATQANATGLLVTDNVEFKEPFSWQPGIVHKVKGVTGEELTSNIRQLKPGPASPQLMDGVKLTIDQAQSSIQSPDVLSGEAGKSGETARGIQMRIEQATKQLSVIGRKFADIFLRQVLLNNAKLNAIHLDDLEVIHITDWKQNIQRPVTIGREMYRRNYGVEIRSDLRFTGEEAKIAEAENMFQMVTTVPVLAYNIPLAWAAFKAVLEAHKRYDLIPLIGPEPPPVQTPLGLPPPQPPGTPPPEAQ